MLISLLSLLGYLLLSLLIAALPAYILTIRSLVRHLARARSRDRLINILQNGGTA